MDSYFWRWFVPVQQVATVTATVNGWGHLYTLAGFPFVLFPQECVTEDR